MSKRYISYFQSVITLGVITSGDTEEQVIENAKNKLKDKEGVNHCYFDQTPFEITAVEGWNPEFESEKSEEGLKFHFNPGTETKNVIATRLHKDVESLTETDYDTFVKDCIQKALSVEA